MKYYPGRSTLHLVTAVLLTGLTASITAPAVAQPACEGLGLREFAVSKPPGAFLASPLGGADISGQEWLTDTLDICAGPDAGDGLHPLTLNRDATLGIPTIVPGLVACVKLYAAGSHGTIDCEGGAVLGVHVTQNSHGPGPEDPPVILSGQGEPGRPGEATLFADMGFKLLENATSSNDCLAQVYDELIPVALTTASGTLTIEEANDQFGGQAKLEIGAYGKNFSCPDWTDADSPGTLIAPIATLDMPFVGDAAAILRLGSAPEHTGALCDAGDLPSTILAAGNSEDEQLRYQLLAELAASLNAGDPLLADLQLLLPVIDRWANGRESYWEPGEQALNASGYLANFFDLKATPGSDYPPRVDSASPLCPIWAMYRGRMLIQQVIQTAFILNDSTLRNAYFGEGREALSIAAAAFPQNRVVRMWLDEPIPWAALPEDPNAPAWANRQREALGKLADIIDYWIDERQAPDGQFGGGWSDDVEMWRLWTPLLVGFQDNKIETAQRLLAEGIFALPRLAGGYTSILTDVEHSSEDTGDTITAMLHIDPADPDWAARAERLAQLMEDLWGGYNANGLLQFQSGYFTSTENATDPDFACDTPYHSRTLQPALLLWQRTRDTQLTDLLTQWLDTWVDATARAERGKPAGVVPAAIHWPSGEPAGPGPNWWDPGCALSTDRDLFIWPSQITPKLQSLVLAWWITGDERYLAPLHSMADLRRAYLAAPNNNAPAGSAQWVGRRLGDNLGHALAKYRVLSGDTGFDDLLSRNASPYMKYRLNGDATPLLSYLNNTLAALRNNREAYTSEVRWTDRLFRFAPNYTNYFAAPALPTPSVDTLYSMLTGDPGDPLYLPLNAVRWQTSPRDFAALVESSSPVDVSASLYHFGAGSRTVGAQFLNLDAGRYNWSMDCGTAVVTRGSLSVHAQDKPAVSFNLPARRLCSLELQKAPPVGC